MRRPVSSSGRWLALLLPCLLAACGDDAPSTSPRFEACGLWGVPSAVAVGPDGTVYLTVTALFSGKSQLRALSPNGQVKWSLPFGGTPVVGPDGTLYVSGTGYLWAIGAGQQVLWKADAGGLPAVAGDGVVYLAAELKDPSIASATLLTAVLPGGQIGWDAVLYGTPAGRPVVGGDGTVLVPLRDPAGKQASLQAVSRQGAELWSVPLAGNPGELAVGGDGTVYVGDAAGLRALGPGGQTLWQTTVPGGVASPVLGPDGRIYAAGGSGVVAFGANGQQLWTVGGVAVTGGLAVGKDGRIYVTGRNSKQDLAIVVVDPAGAIERSYDPVAWTSFEGPPAIGPGGEVYAPGRIFYNLFSMNERTGTASAEVGMETCLVSYASTAEGGLAASAWPRNGADNGNAGLAVAGFALPDAAAVTGMWGAVVGGEQRVLDLRADGSASLYRYPKGTPPEVAAESAWSYAAGQLTLGDKARTVYPSSIWQLVLADPVDGQKRSYRRIHAPPAPPDPSATWGDTRWTFTGARKDTGFGADLAVLADGGVASCGWTDPIAFTGSVGTPEALHEPGAFCAAVGESGWQWVYRHQGQVRQIERLPDGGIVLFGQFPATPTAAAGHVQILSPQGQLLSTGTIQGWDADGVAQATQRRYVVHALAVHPSGDLVLAGESVAASKATHDLSEADAFVGRFRQDGQQVWLRELAGSGNAVRERFARVAVSPGGVIGVVGATEGPIDLGTGAVGPAVGQQATYGHLLVAAFGADGQTRWAHAFPSHIASIGAGDLGVGLDGEDHLVVAGTLSHVPLQLGTGAMQVSAKEAENGADAFVARFDPQGKLLWQQKIHDPEQFQSVGGLGVDPAGNIALAVRTDKEALIGATAVQTRGGAGFFLFQLDACGQVLWQKDARPYGIGARSLALGAGGDVAISGLGSGLVDIGDGFLDWAQPHAIERSLNLNVAGFYLARFRGAGDGTREPGGALRDCAKAPKPVGKGQQLEVVIDKQGTGKGQVVSEPAGIACPPTCKAEFPALATVSLQAVAEAGSHFAGWDKDCQGLQPCAPVLEVDRKVHARFERPGFGFSTSLGNSILDAVAADAGGRIYAGGRLDAGTTADFGAGPVTAASGEGVLAAYDDEGKLLWHRLVTGAGLDAVGDVAAVPAGGVVAVGASSSGDLDLGTGPLAAAGTYRPFVARYAADGKPLWAQLLAGEAPNWEHQVAVDGQGTVWVAGTFGRVDALAANGAPGVSVVTTGAWILDLAGMPDGGVAYAGLSQGEVKVAGASIGVPTGRLFLLRLDVAGKPLWTHHVPQPPVAMGAAVAAAADGRLVWAAPTAGTDLALGTVSQPGDSTAILAAFAADGTPTALHRFAEAGFVRVGGLAWRLDGRLLLAAGPGEGSVLDGQVVAGQGALYLAAYDGGPAPQAAWSLLAGAQGTALFEPQGLALLPGGDVVLATGVTGSAVVGPHTLGQGGALVRLQP